MAGVTQYVLKGGPCNGRTGELTPGIISAGQVTCNGHVYKIDEPVKIDGGREVFADTGAVPKQTPAPNTPHSHTAWHDLQRSVNKRWPDAISAASASRRAALRNLARAHRVRI